MLRATLPPNTSADTVNEDGFDMMVSEDDVTNDDEVALQFVIVLSAIIIAHCRILIGTPKEAAIPLVTDCCTSNVEPNTRLTAPPLEMVCTGSA
jgi:hypothetical protein